MTLVILLDLSPMTTMRLGIVLAGELAGIEILNGPTLRPFP